MDCVSTDFPSWALFFFTVLWASREGRVKEGIVERHLGGNIQLALLLDCVLRALEVKTRVFCGVTSMMLELEAAWES